MWDAWLWAQGRHPGERRGHSTDLKQSNRKSGSDSPCRVGARAKEARQTECLRAGGRTTDQYFCKYV